MIKSHARLKNDVMRLADETSEVCSILSDLAILLYTGHDLDDLQIEDPEEKARYEIYLELYSDFLYEFLEDMGIEIAVAIHIKKELGYHIL